MRSGLIGAPYYGGAIYSGSVTGASTCIVETDVVDQHGVATAGVIARLKVAAPQKSLSGPWVLAQEQTVTSDSSGHIVFAPVPRGIKMLLFVEAENRAQEITIPNAATYTV